ncbi:Pyridoxal-dependent decarboxylase [Isosphaera pallida ATCC 43644]|jgi:glutamate/tyrosine decarboxylase-like PLP-dependent enzyme|uniref:Pyridoxal-dependent decarboxylase n=1 Tax=Isosphaera pallida (strain ATCC 43644 / DSM 9630 / IS1B) TaxID=575540 RepID=E8R1U1_ISOPI|nr:pyridoxal-dependent decarboxylase [Isosphaera pallida]ADV61363.1 Pyridoxal-dependent decarboxylase [Isosphaera pallida ATCC 43644]
MDRAKYDHVVKNFFTCDPAALTEILQELLAALSAEETLPPVHAMSQNYETAQANPEIHILPGNLKDARDAIFPYFWGTDGWSSPLHLENVRGPANYASFVGAVACLLKNPNLCTDTYAQRSNELEVKSVTALANLLFYHTRDPWGIFTIGGTISNMYGARIGIEKVVPGAMRQGLREWGRVVGIVSEASHYCNQTIAGWTGMGTDNLLAIPTDPSLAMRLDRFAETLDRCYQRGDKVAFVIPTFGTTDAFGVDDVEGIRAILDETADRHGQPRPHLHVDAAVGWVLAFFSAYDFNDNPLHFSPDLLALLKRAVKHARGLRYADSVTLDFHKMGWGHYPASAFIVNQKSDLKYLSRSVAETPYFAGADPRRDPALFSLECSRPGLGPYTVMASLNGLGLTGWQLLVARSLELADKLKDRLERLDYCKVLNRDTTGPSVVFQVYAKGRDAKAIHREVEEGTMTPERYARFASEVRRLFEKREKTMDPRNDARLSFTTNIGYKPHGLSLPAWKAVFFNPRTDETVIDRLIDSIEELV